MDDVRDFGPPVPDGPPRSARRTIFGWLAGSALALLSWVTTQMLWSCVEFGSRFAGAAVCFAVAAMVLFGLGAAGIAWSAAAWGSPGESDAARRARRWIAITGWSFGSILMLAGLLYAVLTAEPQADHPSANAVLVVSGIVDALVLLPLTGVGVARGSRWSRVKAPFPWL